jgi:sugar O-acyltransferase (sialic acid O-acetyltransferase NeuD family)
MPTPDPIIIFGTNTFATALAELIRDEGDLEPVAFCVERPYAVGPEHEGLPLVPLDELAARFTPARHRALVPLGFLRMMTFRAEMCDRLEEMGYSLAPWISRHAAVWSRLELGPNSFVMPGATILPYARLGRDVSIRPNVVVSHHCTVEDHVTLANGVILGGGSTIGANSWVGLGAVVRDDVTLAPRTFVGAGAMVTADTEEDGIYVGVPARRSAGPTATEFTSS